MIFIWILLCVFFLWLSYLINKDFASPVFVSGAIWLAVYFLLFFTQDHSELADIYYGSFFMAFFCFFIGFFATSPQYKNRQEKIQYEIEWNPRFKKFILMIEYATAIFWLFSSWNYITTRTASVWLAVRHSATEISYLSRGIMGIIHNMIPIIFFVSFGMYLCNPTKKNRNDTLISIPPMLMTMLFASRGEWFYILITCVFIAIFIKKPKNSTILYIGATGIVIILVVFVISSFDKFSNAWLEMSKLEKLNFFFTGYFVAPPISFVDWLHSTYELQYGKYTFRFLYAVLSVIYPDIEVVNTVLPFVVTKGVRTNVYTAIQWYAHDFGLWWSFVMEFLLGLFYGKRYLSVRKSQTPTLFSIILLAMFMYPIANQFFAEQIVSILSLWIQRGFWLFLFTRTRLSIRENQKEGEYKTLHTKVRITYKGRPLL